MPLRDHFHPPVSRRSNWEGFHGLWPGEIAKHLNRRLPARYVAEPRVHVGPYVEIDVASFELDEPAVAPPGDGGAAWAPSAPSLLVETELLSTSEYEVRVYDERRDRHLVAAVEIVSPANKDRPDTRQAFVGKCEALLRKGVSVGIIDLVTPMHFNLYAGLLEMVGQRDPIMGAEPPAIYAASCRWVERGRKRFLETWAHVLRIGQPLPTLPLWVADTHSVPLELEEPYEETCRGLRIA